jgi:hypothetical protein
MFLAFIILLILIIGCKPNQQATKAVPNETAQKNIATEKPSTVNQTQTLPKNENKADSEITSMEIGPEGGEFEVTNSNIPIVGARFKVLDNIFSDKANISIIPVLDLPQKKGCVIKNGIRLTMDPMVKINKPFPGMMLAIPFPREYNDEILHLVFSYNLTSKEWDESPVAPLPGPPNVFNAPLDRISNELVYYPMVCNMTLMD